MRHTLYSFKDFTLTAHPADGLLWCALPAPPARAAATRAEPRTGRGRSGRWPAGEAPAPPTSSVTQTVFTQAGHRTFKVRKKIKTDC